jgi:DNA polymerase III alpha subunit (gram-positive type)
MINDRVLYLPFDTETGGLGNDVSLLELYMDVLDESFNLLDSIHLFTKPNDDVYRVTAGGLYVNKINLVDHDKKAKAYSQAGQELVQFLKQNSQNGKYKLIPLGKNIAFDIRKVTDNLLGEKTWGQYVSYRNIDITTLARCLQIKAKLPFDMSISLDTLRDFFKIEIPGAAHTADYDTRITVLVFKELLKLI